MKLVYLLVSLSVFWYCTCCHGIKDCVCRLKFIISLVLLTLSLWQVGSGSGVMTCFQYYFLMSWMQVTIWVVYNICIIRSNCACFKQSRAFYAVVMHVSTSELTYFFSQWIAEALCIQKWQKKTVCCSSKRAGGIGLTNYCLAVPWRCWLGHLIRKIVHEMAYVMCQLWH